MSGLFRGVADFIRGSQSTASTSNQNNVGASIEEITAETQAVTIATNGNAVNGDTPMEVDMSTTTEVTVLETAKDADADRGTASASHMQSTSRTISGKARSSSVPLPGGAEEKFRFGYVYDVRMMAHMPVVEVEYDHPEQPDRIRVIYDKLVANDCIVRMKRLKIRPVEHYEAILVHSEDHWERVQMISRMDRDEIVNTAAYYSALSLYVSENTTQSALLSCGGAIEASLAVARGELERTLAIVRPPGHHAEPEEHMGFCFFNNVSVAARVVQQLTPVKKILILDWDVHHGNGTQKAFLDDPSVLYISLHVFMGGSFYPNGPFGGIDSFGEGLGKGYSVNIPWPEQGMGDADYLLAFQRIVMPIAMEFNPDLVMISAGFDAADGDDLGGCKVSPVGYAHMTHMLMSLSAGRIVVALEGGYNLDAISNSALAVTRVLLGDAPPEITKPLVAKETATETIWQVVKMQSRKWKNLDVKACEPGEEPFEEILSIPEVLKLHRQEELFRKYGMLEIPLLDPEVESRLQSQVICSHDFMDSKETVVLFVHQFGNIRVELAGARTCDVQLQNSYLRDVTHDLLQWITKSGFGYTEVNTYPNPVKSNLRKSQTELADDAVVYLWDNYVLLSGAQNIILMGHGPGCATIMNLIAKRKASVMHKVRAVALVVGMEDIPATPRYEDELRKWYVQHSLVAAPRNHPFNLNDTVRKKHGRVRFFEDQQSVNLLREALPSITDFIEAKLAAQPTE